MKNKSDKRFEDLIKSKEKELIMDSKTEKKYRKQWEDICTYNFRYKEWEYYKKWIEEYLDLELVGTSNYINHPLLKKKAIELKLIINKEKDGIGECVLESKDYNLKKYPSLMNRYIGLNFLKYLKNLRK